MTISYDPFSLTQEDREFVFELVDRLQSYSSQNEDEDEEEDDAGA